ncbi:MAG: hypothetical protein HYX20_01345 [Candidatus Yanofskybacteria bacterium]|nr:hypothetical protein [Candidatus Yanofskybacteria bacterium]
MAKNSRLILSQNERFWKNKVGVAQTVNIFAIVRPEDYQPDDFYIEFYIESFSAINNNVVAADREVIQLSAVKFVDETYFLYDRFADRTPGGNLLTLSKTYKCFFENRDGELISTRSKNIKGRAEVITIFGACKCVGESGGEIVDSFHTTKESAKLRAKGEGYYGVDAGVEEKFAIKFNDGTYILLNPDWRGRPCVLVQE